MRFTPKSEKEMQEERLLAKGEYDAEIVDAEDAVSKSGNEMIKVKLRVMNGSQNVLIDDYLLAIDSMLYKILHCCECCGLSEAYASGELEAHQLKGKNVRVKVKIDEGKGDFPSKNAIADYIPERKQNAGAGKLMTDGVPASKTRAAKQASDDADVPF